MEEFWFYIKLGLNHVLDFGAYDHILFLAALAVPFTFKSWKKVIILATVFTITHCVSLALSVYNVFVIDVVLIEFLIPITILITALLNLYYIKYGIERMGIGLHVLATAFFGLVHGFGFSNYFKLLMAEEEEKLNPLLGFATGIEFSQILIILVALVLSYVSQTIFRMQHRLYIIVFSIIVIVITLPMVVKTFPFIDFH
ncbi:MAG: HupE/UreJ family protein [Bacteroidota bacterium]